jgi:flagellar hook-basal body complex protein FliE
MRIEAGSGNVFRELPRTERSSPAQPLESTSESSQPSSDSPFLQRLGEAVRGVNELQQNASEQATKLATGEVDNVEDVVIALEKADLALQLTVQVTQKAIEAYREISRMQV